MVPPRTPSALALNLTWSGAWTCQLTQPGKAGPYAYYWVPSP